MKPSMQLGRFEYLGKSVRRIDLGGLGLALTQYPSDQRQPWHEHENPTLFLLLEGDFIDKSGALGERTLATFDMVCHPSGARHAGEAGPRGRAGLNIEPTSEWLRRYGLEPRHVGEYRVQRCPTSSLHGLKLALALMEGDAALLPVADDIVLDSVLPLLSLRETRRFESKAWFQKLENYLEQSDLRECSLRRMAEALAVHPVYLARVFRRQFGCSLGEYVLRRRLVHAAETVLRHGGSLGEAAHRAGFSDQAHLTRMFRREIGRTPRAMRQLRETLLRPESA